MSVFTATKQWSKCQKIPYRISVDDGLQEDDVKTWIAAIDEKLGYKLFMEKETTNPQVEPCILLKYKSYSAGHSSIGKPESGNREVEFNTEKKFYHELLHALGFNHEQYHNKYPWNREDPLLNSIIPTTYTFRDKSTTDENTKIYNTLVENYGGDFGADGQLRQLYLVANSSDWLFSEAIDPKSIMMYESSAKSIIDGFTESTELSEGDIAEIQKYYPECC